MLHQKVLKYLCKYKIPILASNAECKENIFEILSEDNKDSHSNTTSYAESIKIIKHLMSSTIKAQDKGDLEEYDCAMLSEYCEIK